MEYSIPPVPLTRNSAGQVDRVLCHAGPFESFNTSLSLSLGQILPASNTKRGSL